MALAETFAVRPHEWQSRIERAFQKLAGGKADSGAGINLFLDLAQEVDQLAK